MKKNIKIPSSLWMIFIFSFITLSIHSQIIVLKETVPDDFEELDEGFGPNRKRFSHPLASYGTFSNKYDHTGNVSDKTLFGKSIDLNSGTRSYLKLSKIYALTFDFGLSFRMFGLKLNESSILPLPTTDLSKARYWMTSVGAAFGNQINLKPKRGNQLGTYFNIGAYGNFNFLRRYTSWYNNNDVIPYKYKITLKNFKDLNLFDYGAVVKYGKPNYTLFVKYRISNLFLNKDFTLNELPRITFGIELFSSRL
jgi:hypothetical protein